MAPLLYKDIQEMLKDNENLNSFNNRFYKRIYGRKFPEICHIFNDLQSLRYMDDSAKLETINLLLERCAAIEASIDETD